MNFDELKTSAIREWQTIKKNQEPLILIGIPKFFDLPMLVPQERIVLQDCGLIDPAIIHHSYLRQDAMTYFGNRSGISLSRLYAVARFHGALSLKPRGRSVIRACLGTACHLRGGGIADAIVRELSIVDGETTPTASSRWSAQTAWARAPWRPLLPSMDDIMAR